jgi:hypothetical protein
MHHLMQGPTPGSGRVRSEAALSPGRALAYWREAAAVAVAFFAAFMWAAFAIGVQYESQVVVEINQRGETVRGAVPVEERLRSVLCDPERLARLPVANQADLGSSCSAIQVRASGVSQWLVSFQADDPNNAMRGAASLGNELVEAAPDGMQMRVTAQAAMPPSPLPSMRPALFAASGPVSIVMGVLWALGRARGFGRKRTRRADPAPPHERGEPDAAVADDGRTLLAAEVHSEEAAVALLVVPHATGFDVIGSMTRVAGRTPPPVGAGEESSVPRLDQKDPAAAEREALHLIEEGGSGGAVGVRVHAWHTLAIVRERRGAWASAVEARRGAVGAARAEGLTERECFMQVDLGSLLAAIGARTEAYEAMAAGLEIARRTGYEQGLRRARVNLMGWNVTFGPDAGLEPELFEIRVTADNARRGGWIASDRTALALLFQRACELIASNDPPAIDGAAALLQMTVEASRTTGNDAYLPLALGMWARAELSREDTERAVELGEQARTWLTGAAPGLLDPSPVYLALHDAYARAGDDAAARGAVVDGLTALLRRLPGVAGTPYAGGFLHGLPYTVALLDHARRHGVLLADLKAQMESAS